MTSRSPSGELDSTMGMGLSPGEIRELITELDNARAAALVPGELVVRVHRQPGLTGWTAEHPLFRGRRQCEHPAGALVPTRPPRSTIPSGRGMPCPIARGRGQCRSTSHRWSRR